MNSAQKAIKYMAIVFAVFLAVTILATILRVGISLLNAVTGGAVNANKTKDFESVYTNIENIDLDTNVYQVDIRKGDELKVVLTNVSEDYSVKAENRTLKLKEKDSWFIPWNWFENIVSDSENSGHVVVYVPEGYQFKRFSIDGGVGDVSAEYINASRLDIDTGVGNVTGDTIISDDVDIDGGVGNVTLDNVLFKKTKLDGGVGNIRMQGIIEGDLKIDGGVGDVNLSLAGKLDDYNIKCEGGLGSIKVNGNKYNDMEWKNDMAPYNMKLEGGVGDIRIEIY